MAAGAGVAAVVGDGAAVGPAPDDGLADAVPEAVAAAGGVGVAAPQAVSSGSAPTAQAPSSARRPIRPCIPQSLPDRRPAVQYADGRAARPIIRAGMDETTVRQALIEARDADGRPLLAPDEIAEIAIEDGWIGVLVGREATRLQPPSPERKEPAVLATEQRDLLTRLHDHLTGRFPTAEVELRAPGTVYRGGAGFGPGRHVVAVLGGKGGVGKSTVAVNLALTLAAMNLRVGVLDGDVNGPDVPHLLGFHQRRPQSGMGWSLHTMRLVPPSRRRRPHRRYDVELMSVGFVVPEGAPTMLHGRIWVSALLRYLIFDVTWGADVLLIDAPPGTGDELHVMAAELPLSGALFVTTPQDLAQMDAERTLALLRRHGVPVIGLVQNMAALTCPHCEREIDMFAQSTRLSSDGVAVLGRIPFDVRLSTAADRGMPLVLADGRGEIAREFARIAVAVRRWLAQPPASG